MERNDIRRHTQPPDPPEAVVRGYDRVILDGSGREAELIEMGLKLLLAKVTERDIVSRPETRFDTTTYPPGNSDGARLKSATNQVPLRREVELLLEDTRPHLRR